MSNDNKNTNSTGTNISENSTPSRWIVAEINSDYISHGLKPNAPSIEPTQKPLPNPKQK